MRQNKRIIVKREGCIFGGKDFISLILVADKGNWENAKPDFEAITDSLNFASDENDED